MQIEKHDEKRLLLPPVAGVDVMKHYGLYCEDRYNWAVESNPELMERTLSGHAPFEWDYKGNPIRLNLASPDDDFRQWSYDLLAQYIRSAGQTPKARTVVLHSAPRFWPVGGGAEGEVQVVGEYGRLIPMLKKLARLAGDVGVKVVVENNCTRWDEVPIEDEWDSERHLGHVRQYFATYPEEWAQLACDVDEPALGLCLDSSHVTNFAQRFPLDQRPAIYHRFMDLAGDRLWHVHWNDNYMHSKDGRADPHLNVGQGTVPLDVHRRLWQLPSVRTMLLEHWRGEEALVEELAFIQSLYNPDLD